MDSLGESSSSSSYPQHNPMPNSNEQHSLLNDRSKRKDKSPAQGYGSIPNVIDQPSQDHGQWKPQFCLAFGIFFGLVFLVSLVLLLLAPGFAQRSFATDVQFEFYKASILNASDDQGVDVLTMHVVGTIVLRNNLNNLAGLASKVFGSVGISDTALEVYHAQPSQSKQLGAIGTIDLPPLSLSRTTNTTTFDFITRFVVEDTEALIAFCQDAVASETVLWRVAGPVPLQIGNLPIHTKVRLDKVVRLEGMNGLKNSEMLSVSFPGPHPLGGIRLDSQVGIYNPSSVISLTLGNVDFGIYLPPGPHKGEEEEVVMAVVRADDAHLLGQRVNKFNVSGRSIAVPENGQQRMEQLISAYIHGNTSFVHVRGSAYGPEDSLQSSTPAWLRQALQSITLRVPFPGTQQTDLIQSIKFSNLNIDLSKGNSSPLISGDAVALLKKPDEMHISLNVTQIDPLVYLYLYSDSEDPFASLAPDRPCPAKTVEGASDLPENMFRVFSRIEKAPFSVMPGKEDEFKKFLEKVFYRKTSTVYFKGTTSAVVNSALGVLNIRDLPFKGEIDTKERPSLSYILFIFKKKGMEGMKDPSPTVESMSVVKGYQESLHAIATLVIYNPSDVHVNLGAVNMLLIYNDQIIGNASLSNLVLAPVQNNRVKAYVWLHHGHSLSTTDNYPLAPTENPKPLIDFIGQYLALEKVNLTISGKHPHASASKLLLPLLKQFTFNTSPPILSGPPLLKNTQVNLLSSTAVLWLQNPFPNLAIQILRIHAKANYREDEVGTIDVDFTDKGSGMNGPLLLPACNEKLGRKQGDKDEECTEQETQKLPVITKKVGMDAIKKAIGGKIQLSIDSTVDVLVDAFLLEHLRYVRDNVTATIHKGF
ncbi:hypothetical protein CLU79DRAFT_448547 [Phycomyces nitens]|nr:hypothetical protein CLU79DRAFT_448547 [Phycomyces nitens]